MLQSVGLQRIRHDLATNNTSGLKGGPREVRPCPNSQNLWKGSLQCNQVKSLEMRSSWATEVGPKSNDKCLYKRQKRKPRHRDKSVWKWRQRLKQYIHRDCWKPPEAEKVKEASQDVKRGCGPADTWFWTGPQNRKKIYFRGFKPYSLWWFVTTVPGNEYSSEVSSIKDFKGFCILED